MSIHPTTPPSSPQTCERCHAQVIRSHSGWFIPGGGHASNVCVGTGLLHTVAGDLLPAEYQRHMAFVAMLEMHALECHFCPPDAISCHFCGEVKEIHPESFPQFGEPTCIICFNTTMRSDPTNEAR